MSDAAVTDLRAAESSVPKLSGFAFWRQSAQETRKRSQSAHPQPPPGQIYSSKLSAALSSSSPHLPAMAAAVAAPPQPPRLFPPDSETLDTLHDPRTPSTSSTVSRNDSVLDDRGQADFNEQIAKLSEKLVNSINHQTSLDDSLQQARHELEIAKKTIAELEAKARAHAELISSGLLMTKEAVDKQEETMRAELESEKDLRLRAEKEKKNMEQELETLTSALFQEANTMVADARKDKEASDRKNDQLRNQIKDTEILLESQQAQLQDLKGVLEKMTMEQAETESVTRASTSAPSTPAVQHSERMSRLFESAHFTPNLSAEDAVPDHPLHFSHLIQPVLRTDIQAYEDFASVIRAAKAASPPPSRVASGSYGSLAAVTGIATQAVSASPTLPALPYRAGNHSPRASTSGAQQLPSMRETKLFKRALAEDIEPTLRLDVAPGVSWMVRRAVMNSIIEGSLVVEPMPPSPVKFRGPINPCALCGENRIGDLYERKHRFRVSEDKETRRYPLCDLCLGRLRSCGDLLSFLRMVTNGHWKADTDDEMRTAWEEYVKLRERMFWHRISGGVVPALGLKDLPGTPPLSNAGSVGRRSEEEARKTDANEDVFGMTTESSNGEHAEKESSELEGADQGLHESPSEATLRADNGPESTSASANQKLSLAIPSQ